MPRFTATRNDDTFVDLQGVTVHYYSWLPAKPKAIILIAHGLGEHALRYEHLAARLNEAGYGVYALDQRGHGATGLAQHGGDTTKLGKLGAGGIVAVQGDLLFLLKRIRGRHEHLPVGLIGHSWGSLIAQRLLNSNPEAIDALVLSGTAYRVPGKMNAGDLNARHKHLGTTGFEWLSRDENVHTLFAEDPLTFAADPAKNFGYLEAAKLFGRPKRNLRRDVPVHIAIGSDDSLGGTESAQALAASLRERSKLSDVSLTVYPGGRHEIFNELNKDRVMNDTVEWLDQHLIGQAPVAPRR
ncbi:alpha/beta hydrolase [Humidisolicoccus flavus]|uniref:alpha/beta hydrolase n=1 Tax=Humidisolicoccus flavus TaxID=3111414 RepID=UPI00325438AB